MQLSSIEYSTIMSAIEYYKFVLENETKDQEAIEALDRVERKIVSDNLPY